MPSTFRLYFLIKNVSTMTSALMWAMESRHDLLFAQSEEEARRHILHYTPDFFVLHHSALHPRSIQFVFELKRKHPFMIPVFWLEKPVRIPTDALPVWQRKLGLAFDAWISEIGEKRGITGTLQPGEYDLEDVLTTLHLEGATGTLEVLTRQSWGWIFLKEGTVVHAQIGRLTGEPAVVRLFITSVGAPPTHFQFLRDFPPRIPGPTIFKPLDVLLLDVERKVDEARER